MTTSRILPREEWSRLSETSAEPWTPPDNAVVVVVERDGAIVARHVLFTAVHAEALWVDPSVRRTLVGGRLWRAVKRAARREFGTAAIVTHAIDEQVRGLIAHVGGHAVPGESFVIPVGE